MLRPPLRSRTWIIAALISSLCQLAFPVAAAGAAVIVRTDAGPLERMAAREVQRYVYLVSGEWPRLGTDGPAAEGGPEIHVTVSGPAEPGVPAGSYSVRGYPDASPARVEIDGVDDQGALYGAYRFAELLGVRFYLHGEVVPDAVRPLHIEPWHEVGRPIFAVRGLQPFHDFAEGPDWWNADDYRVALDQMARLRMNFLGLHTYPESQVGPEPTVWIGLPGDYDENGRVMVAYPASTHTTGRSGRTWWGYDPVATSDFVGGAAALFERDDFGADVMRGHRFVDQTPESAAVVFNRTADLLSAAFRHARSLGILTCIGTETPLTLPAPLVERVREKGREPGDPELSREIYRAMFDRIARAYPADYYWLWTPENWTWEGNRSEQYLATEADILAALGALEDLGRPMTLATCGWVLGPQHDRAALDRLLPPSSPMSAINSAVGHTPIERQFANLSDRPRWAIPWLENDGTITAPQLWTGRMRYDAVDARRLGCTGLIGIHWRTRILAPQISALAGAAWDQSWVPEDFDDSPIPPQAASGATGGRAVADDTVAAGVDAARAPLFRTARVGMPAYDMLVPAGRFTVRLGFAAVAGVDGTFDVRVANQLVEEAVRPSAVARVVEVRDVTLTEARLLIEFVPRDGDASVSFIEVEGVTNVGVVPYARRINCGGPALAGYEADELAGQPRPSIDRSMPVEGFYRDFATVNFGAEAAEAIAAIFVKMDGVEMPLPNHWIDGPGDIKRTTESWSRVSQDYTFVGELEALRPQVRGAANLDRFDYWLHQFRAMRTMAELGCVAGALDREVEAMKALVDPAESRKRAEEVVLPLRRKLGALWSELLMHHIAGASTTGELGGIANLEQRSRVHHRFLDRHDEALTAWLGRALPADVHPVKHYTGPAHIVVPTVRTTAGAGEAVNLRVRFASRTPAKDAVLRWRRIGETAYQDVPLRHVARAVYDVTLPTLDAAHPAIEYHLTATLDGQTQRWPVSDRGKDQVVVLVER